MCAPWIIHCIKWHRVHITLSSGRRTNKININNFVFFSICICICSTNFFCGTVLRWRAILPQNTSVTLPFHRPVEVVLQKLESKAMHLQGLKSGDQPSFAFSFYWWHHSPWQSDLPTLWVEKTFHWKTIQLVCFVVIWYQMYVDNTTILAGLDTWQNWNPGYMGFLNFIAHESVNSLFGNFKFYSPLCTGGSKLQGFRCSRHHIYSRHPPSASSANCNPKWHPQSRNYVQCVQKIKVVSPMISKKNRWFLGVCRSRESMGVHAN